jgi:hypothetical protein
MFSRCDKKNNLSDQWLCMRDEQSRLLEPFSFSAHNIVAGVQRRFATAHPYRRAEVQTVTTSGGTKKRGIKKNEGIASFHDVRRKLDVCRVRRSRSVTTL